MTSLPVGATVALATPLDENGALDHTALAKLVARVVEGGVVGISPTGSTGEGPRLDRDTRVAVTRAVREQAPTGMPVVSGVPLTSVSEGLRELDLLAENGATAALVAPPYYYPLTDADAVGLYEHLADRSSIPLVLYNIPVFTKVRFAPDVVRRLAAHPNVTGIKDSSRDMEYFQQVVAATEGADFAVLTGSDTMLVASLLSGGHGTIAASANLVPELSAGICCYIAAGELDQALAAQRRLQDVIHACRGGTPPAAWKAALHHAGVCEPYLAPPATGLGDAEYRTLMETLESLGV
ncbi:MAG: dihydrodipicolinate synthase family protein [Acidothermales bacterium]|nr:dihydrodipicolinate synthase family protein [Acidothermales bacterium]